MPEVHPSAIVEAGACLADDVRVGPFSLVGADVALGPGVRLISHAVVTGRTRVGARTTIYPFASIGHPPQDLKYAGEPSRLEIGEDNVIREQVTMNPGTRGGGMLTRVGSRCLFMVGAHVAHDCRIGDRVIMANNATLAGHVVVEDDAIIGGLAAVHQHVRIGRFAMIGGLSGVEHDVIPYGLAMGERARLSGVNIVGMRRRGFARADIQAMIEAYGQLFRHEGTLAERLEALDHALRDRPAVGDMIAFVKAGSNRALCQPKEGNGH